jgi:hypothetical protein
MIDLTPPLLPLLQKILTNKQTLRHLESASLPKWLSFKSRSLDYSPEQRTQITKNTNQLTPPMVSGPRPALISPIRKRTFIMLTTAPTSPPTLSLQLHQHSCPTIEHSLSFPDFGSNLASASHCTSRLLLHHTQWSRDLTVPLSLATNQYAKIPSPLTP